MKPEMVGNRQRLVSEAILVCIGVLLILISDAVFQHPASVFPGDLSAAAITACGIAIICAWSVRSLYARALNLQLVLLVGATVGAFQGVIEAVNITFEYSPDGSHAVHTLAVPLSMALMVLLFSGAGSLSYDRTLSLPLAALAGLWCASVGTVLTGLYGFAYNLVQMAHMIDITQTAFARSGLVDPQAYVVRSSIDSLSTHFFLAPMLGAFSGCAGGLVSAQLRGRPRLLAGFVSAMSLGLLASSIGLIRFGLTFARADRAPYISGGMIGSALALICLWPAIRAVLSHLHSTPTPRQALVD